MRRTTGDEGFTLIETVVALLVFAVLSTGLVSTTIAISRMTADNVSREVAANFIAQDLDTVRAIGDPFKVLSSTTTQTVSGRLYTLVRTATWQSTTGQDTSCGTSSALGIKRINDTVTWAGQLATTDPVRGDTLLAPTGLVTSTSSGAISILATTASNAGAAGLTVAVTPTSGGAALNQQPPATDANGCSVASLVTPGTYSVTLSRSGYLTPGQASTSVATNVVVSAGTTTPVTAQYDAATSFAVTYTPTTATLPTNLPTTFVPYSSSAGGACVTAVSAATVPLYPFTAGYSAIAGATGTSNTTPSCGAVSTAAASSCLAVDPAQWPATTLLAAGARGTSSASALSARVGTVAVTASSAAYLTAVSATDPAAPGDGNPGCNTSTTLTFGQVLTAGTVTVGLPFGSWRLYSGASAGSTTTQISATALAPSKGAVTTTGGVVVTTLDPRVNK